MFFSLEILVCCKVSKMAACHAKCHAHRVECRVGIQSVAEIVLNLDRTMRDRPTEQSCPNEWSRTVSLRQFKVITRITP